jgi:hypothetical protein
MARDTSLRINRTTHNKEAFVWILKYADRQFPVITGLPLGDFPANIKRWIWSHFGDIRGVTNDEEWHLLCELNNGNFAYYVATGCYCCYKGLSERAYVTINVTSDLASLITNIMDESTYATYMQETVAADPV